MADTAANRPGGPARPASLRSRSAPPTDDESGRTIGRRQNTEFTLFEEHWSPKIIAQANGWEIKLVRAQGTFIWHDHDVDEVFCVFAGQLSIHLEDQPSIHLRPGEIFVVPRGMRHRPEARSECQLLLLEPPGAINTGQSAGKLTAVDEWI
jgi:mannose-6-phosphate isomerase-like protein (cupin superfamily)